MVLPAGRALRPSVRSSIRPFVYPCSAGVQRRAQGNVPWVVLPRCAGARWGPLPPAEQSIGQRIMRVRALVPRVGSAAAADP